MKKIIAVLIVLFVMGGAMAFADHPGTGIGVVFSTGYGGTGFGGDIGVSFKLPSIPVMWAASIGLNDSILRLGLVGDYYFFVQDLVTDGSFNLDWFFGVGGYANFWLGNDFGFGIGARAPIGLSWHIIPQLELALALVPSLGIYVNDGVSLGWGVGADLALRYWF